MSLPSPTACWFPRDNCTRGAARYFCRHALNRRATSRTAPVDNLCHTLAGAAMARSGLERRTPMAAATLMIGANLPDLDVLAIPFVESVTFRRGITHGLPALVILPLLLTAGVLGYDRWRARRDPERPRAVPRQVLLLAVLGVLSHPVLDFMNSYGMRWLMPMRGTWFYGDALFIVDPWLLLLLGAAVWARRRAVEAGAADPWRVARRLTAAAAAYVTLMLGASEYLRSRAAWQLGMPPGVDRRILMVGPVPLLPHRREVVWLEGDEYRFARVSLLRPSQLEQTDPPLPIGDYHPAVHAAAQTEPMRGFLDWSRFPYFRVDSTEAGMAVTAADARYSRRDAKGWAVLSVVVPHAQAGGALD
jgi:inner membrane protein